VLDALSRHKLAILALLRPGHDGWTAQDWRAYFEQQRRKLAAHNGRPGPEASAFDCCVVE
jgi:hypothetical protein